MNILIELLTKSVFALSNETVTENCSGLPTGGLSGIGYNYYINGKYRICPELHKFLSKRVIKDISYSESQRFCKEFEKLVLPDVMSGKMLSWRDHKSLFEVLSSPEVTSLEANFSQLSTAFIEKKDYIFPLRRFEGDSFAGTNFSITAKTALNADVLRVLDDMSTYNSINFWLIISARNSERAFEKMEVVCGALALAMNGAERHTFSMGSILSGHFTGTGSFHSSPARVVPALRTDFKFSAEDVEWLKILDKILVEGSSNSKCLQALRFFFMAWFATSQERFALNCMALDALVPKKHRSMKAKCEWLRDMASVKVDLYAIEMLFKKLRSSVMHGDSASLPACRDYPVFIDDYRVEPLSALDAMTADVLRRHIFGLAIKTKISLAESDPEIRAGLERIFGHKTFEAMRSHPNLLEILNKSHLSSWEKNMPQTNVITRFYRRIIRCIKGDGSN